MILGNWEIYIFLFVEEFSGAPAAENQVGLVGSS